MLQRKILRRLFPPCFRAGRHGLQEPRRIRPERRPRRDNAQGTPIGEVLLDIRFFDEHSPAPVDLLGNWTVLVWSEAGKAEGEKEKINLLYSAYT
jgi:hypothetical protein